MFLETSAERASSYKLSKIFDQLIQTTPATAVSSSFKRTMWVDTAASPKNKKLLV